MLFRGVLSAPCILKLLSRAQLMMSCRLNDNPCCFCTSFCISCLIWRSITTCICFSFIINARLLCLAWGVQTPHLLFFSSLAFHHRPFPGLAILFLHESLPILHIPCFLCSLLHSLTYPPVFKNYLYDNVSALFGVSNCRFPTVRHCRASTASV